VPVLEDFSPKSALVGAVAELLRHALYAQIDEADDADEEYGYHQHHDKYTFQK
jgi:hypothetical protein